ncbi:MAG TPA: IPT/TIG domain-containing protein [Terriglobales bacterium]|nr:IPT/TIG domain-containing protein [Terriglobales bacterium]
MNKLSVSVVTATICLLLSVTLAEAQRPSPILPPFASSMVPVISALHPNSMREGSAPAPIFVTGRNFVRGVTTAQFNGANRATVVFNPEVLAFEPTSEDLAQAGTASVSVVNTTRAGSIDSNKLPFVIAAK